ncbi:hypothetical protein [Paramagnetospirillum kuznetsovii]|uniref:hypothetical protein n=1 Tax=Paramagnetospirillum kuznetsovii TaxID=2053833 RepID=UPI0011BE18D3|nr:hypothetical protein [Paramagnetospirillum kuznetsovii]
MRDFGKIMSDPGWCDRPTRMGGRPSLHGRKGWNRSMMLRCSIENALPPKPRHFGIVVNHYETISAPSCFLCIATSEDFMMLRDWIRNIPMALLRRIVADQKVHGTYIWTLAQEELSLRRQIAA